MFGMEKRALACRYSSIQGVFGVSHSSQVVVTCQTLSPHAETPWGVCGRSMLSVRRQMKLQRALQRLCRLGRRHLALAAVAPVLVAVVMLLPPQLCRAYRSRTGPCCRAPGVTGKQW